jgi:hypothetical protein
MRTIFKESKCRLSPETEAMVEKKLVAVGRLLGEDVENAMLEIEVMQAPAEGRSSEPYRLVAKLVVNDTVYYAEAVKPTPESSADRVRSELESEIRRARGRTRKLIRRGSVALKTMLRFGRE